MVRLAIRFLLFLSIAVAAFSQQNPFGTLTSLPAQKGSLAVAAGDFNSDGFEDMAVANTSAASISIYLGSGDGKFSTATPVSLPTYCSAAYLTAGHFTGASAPDLLAVCALGGVAVLPNAGNGAFGQAIYTGLPSTAWVGNLMLGYIHPAIADLNGDGKPDIAVPTLYLDRFISGWYLLFSNGDGSFQKPVSLPFSGEVPLSVAAGDFNNDGKPDLVAGVGTLSSSTSVLLEFAAGNGDGTFRSPTAFALPADAGSLILTADIDGDGNLDVIFAGSSLIDTLSSDADSSGESAITVYRGDGAGKFKKSYDLSEPTFASGAALVDLSGTGKLDLVVTTLKGDLLAGDAPVGGIEIHPGNGDGTFGNAIPVSFPSAAVPTDMTIADFNNDGQPDLAISSMPSTSLGGLDSFSFDAGLNGLFNQVLAKLPEGNAGALLNSSVAAPRTFTNANGASFATGSLAANSIVSAFGTGFATSTAAASSLPLPTTLGGVTITVKDSSGTTRNASLFYVSPTQINYAIPDGTAAGSAAITIHTGTSTFTVAQTIVAVAPGIFTVNGYAAGQYVRTVNGKQQTGFLTNNGAPVAVNVAGGQTFLVLYGTGIRSHSGTVVATVGSAKINAIYAGAQGTFVGEDQINIQLPASLEGAGEVSISLNVDGHESNAAEVEIQ